MDQGDDRSLPGTGRDVEAELPGVFTERRYGESHELGDGLGSVEFFNVDSSYNPWDDLQWLVATRNDASFYPGPDFRRLVTILDGHIDRVLAGHAGCGCDCRYGTVRGTPGEPEHP